MAISSFPFHILKNPGTITATPVGLAFGVTLDGLTLTSTDDSSGSWLKHQTEALTGKSGGMLTGIDVVAAGWQPNLEFEVRTPPGVASPAETRIRLWIGLFSVKPDAIQLPGSGHHFAAFRFDRSANDTLWQAFANDGGSAPQQSSIGALVVENQIYKLGVSISAGSSSFTIDGGSPTILTKAPGAAALLGLGVRVTALTNAAKSIEWRRASWSFQ